MRTDEDGIAWLLFDKKDASANTLDERRLTELDAVLAKLERDRPRGLVIRSAKPGGFVAGADIAQFRGITDAAQIEALLTRGHAVLDRLDRLPLPTVAVIHGYCLGGGLELALGLRPSHRHRRRELRLSRGAARPASRPRRHGAAAAPDQPGAGDDHDADRQDRARPAGEVARPRRCGDAGAPCPRRREGRRHRRAEAASARPARPAARHRPGAQPARVADAERGRQEGAEASTIRRPTR